MNTFYQLLTGLVGKFMRNHAADNNIWDGGLLGAAEGFLGTAGQLIIDRFIVGEVKTQHRDLGVAFYDYKNAYDKVYHDWILRVYSWMGFPANVISLQRQLMNYWKTRLKILNEVKKKANQWIDIMCSFLQGDSYSPVGFCLSEIPVCMFLQETKGYRMG